MCYQNGLCVAQVSDEGSSSGWIAPHLRELVPCAELNVRVLRWVPVVREVRRAAEETARCSFSSVQRAQTQNSYPGAHSHQHVTPDGVGHHEGHLRPSSVLQVRERVLFSSKSELGRGISQKRSRIRPLQGLYRRGLGLAGALRAAAQRGPLSSASAKLLVASCAPRARLGCRGQTVQQHLVLCAARMPCASCVSLFPEKRPRQSAETRLGALKPHAEHARAIVRPVIPSAHTMLLAAPSSSLAARCSPVSRGGDGTESASASSARPRSPSARSPAVVSVPTTAVLSEGKRVGPVNRGRFPFDYLQRTYDASHVGRLERFFAEMPFDPYMVKDGHVWPI